MDSIVKKKCCALLVLLFLLITPIDRSWPQAISTGTSATDSDAPVRAVVNVIFDTDIWSDIDDMMALAMLNTLEDRHEVNLLAVTISTEDPWCASYVDLIDTFYGHSQIPIGIVHNGINLAAFQKKFPQTTWPVTRYTQTISERKAPNGKPLYPHRLTDGRRAEDAVEVLRKTLAAQADGSVVMIMVGYSTNLAHLLDSGPDAWSPLTGRDLVSKKVRLLSVMGGNYRDSDIEGKVIPKGRPEFNFAADVSSAQKVFLGWPTPIVASGSEIGKAMLIPGSSIDHDFTYVEHHPIADTYREFCREQNASGRMKQKCPHDHATPDLTAVLYAARPDRGYFSLSKPGTITVLPDGGSRFEPSDSGLHRHLILEDSQRARTLEAMVMLTSQPPICGPDKDCNDCKKMAH